jgi:hypothetical protein
VEITRHGGQSRRNDSPNIIPARIHHIECHGGSEIDHHDGSAVPVPGRQSIRKPIGANGVGLRIIDAKAANSAVIELKGRHTPDALKVPAGDGGGHWHHTTEGDCGDIAGFGFSHVLQKPAGHSAAPPCGCGQISRAENALAGSQSHMRVRISDIQQQNHAESVQK